MFPLLILHIAFVFARVSRGNLQDVILSDFLGFFEFDKNGKLRTNKTAKPTFDTVFRLRDSLWRMISLGIKALALLEAPVWTKLDTKTAPFAPIFDNL